MTLTSAPAFMPTSASGLDHALTPVHSPDYALMPVHSSNHALTPASMFMPQLAHIFTHLHATMTATMPALVCFSSNELLIITNVTDLIGGIITLIILPVSTAILVFSAVIICYSAAVAAATAAIISLTRAARLPFPSVTISIFSSESTINAISINSNSAIDDSNKQKLLTSLIQGLASTSQILLHDLNIVHSEIITGFTLSVVFKLLENLTNGMIV
ncbi:hypothetical protein NM688_g321 [Phlebia brevispora]|uniref:Uncharacterized protein n=1 Tax=Phlebia brevispora TaxID=194682 RepID=A0ACC1TEP2_9APHY|nr:hypothetical protein NM688_g321 [Phlebia brevispora]